LNATQFLIGAGASFEMEDVVGFRLLHVACHGNQQQTAKFLLGLGADLLALDRMGWNPLVHAAAQEHRELVDWIIVSTLRPREHPLPDPAGFVTHEGNSVLGLPGWMLALGIVGACACLLVIPWVYLFRRQAQLRKPYDCDSSDNKVEQFVNEVFDRLVETRAETEELCAVWERIPAETLKDLHRVKH